jgi:RNA polymerase sigma factor (sigma-70 family)
MKAERKRIVDELLAELNEVDRTIITLYYSHDKSDAEISRVVNVPRATVQRRRIKAFEYLKKQISGIF